MRPVGSRFVMGLTGLVGSVLVSGSCGGGSSRLSPPERPAASAPARSTAPTRPPPPDPAPATPVPTPEVPTLASRLGSRDGIARIVHGTFERVLSDRRLSRMLRGGERAALEAQVTDHLCLASGGDCTPSGPSLEAAHWGEQVADRDFDRFLEHLRAAMDEAGIPEVEQNELLAIVGPLRARVVAPVRPERADAPPR